MKHSARTSSARATVILIVVTFFWGMSFSVTHTWQMAAKEGGQELLAALTLISLRMPLALILLAFWHPRVIFGANQREFTSGLALGGMLFVGFVLQSWALAYTTPALSAFFTSVCSAWVPLLSFVAFREVPRILTLCGLLVALLGCALLVDGWQLGYGDSLTLLGSLFLAIEMVALDHLGKRMNPARFSGGFFLALGLLGIVGAILCASFGPGLDWWFTWTFGLVSQPRLAFSILGLALLPTAVAFHWMNTYQPSVSASHAALIYLLEPVFSAVISVLLGYDKITNALLLGGSLILLGNLLVEAPGWLARRVRLPEDASR